MDPNIVGALNHPSRDKRMEGIELMKAALRDPPSVATGYSSETGPLRPVTEEVNNHVHTIYSFSPYSPAMAAYKAWEAGLQAVGIMDHDSIAGGDEMLKACAALGIGSTAGIEIRVNMNGTGFENKKLNNPDSLNNAYIAIHGIPSCKFKETAAFLAPISRARNLRNRRQVGKLNAVLTAAGLKALNFDTDIFPLSVAAEGGSITERHILKAMAVRLMETAGTGKKLPDFLKDRFGMAIPKKIKDYLADAHNPHRVFDLIGVLKSGFVERFYEDPDFDECVGICRAVDFALRIGAIPAYAYLGDVTESPTGDKKAEKFEDDMLDELIPLLKKIGFKAITYMPPRNTLGQLKRIQTYCADFGFMEISGVDINSSRQPFNCPIVLEPDFVHLVNATWALIAHEKLATVDERFALFSPENPIAGKPLHVRLAVYAHIGREMDHRNPAEVSEYIKELA